MHGPGDVRAFDRFAPLYDRLMPRADRAALAGAMAHTERPVRRVLDVGGGTGRGVVELEVPEPLVLDAAGGMLRGARARGLGAVAGDAAGLPVRDDAVDAVLVLDALHHMPDQPAVLSEAARVLREGGPLVVREFDPASLAGRGLVAAERLVGFGSTFRRPDDLAGMVDRAGLAATVAERGFAYTVVGVDRRGGKRGTQEG